ncbi:uncharacterized protein LOC144007048 [Festucalex cinctus]
MTERQKGKILRARKDDFNPFKRKSYCRMKYLVPGFFSLALLEFAFVQTLYTQVISPIMNDTMNTSRPSNNTVTKPSTAAATDSASGRSTTTTQPVPTEVVSTATNGQRHFSASSCLLVVSCAFRAFCL